MNALRVKLVVHAVAAGVVSLSTGWIGSGILFCLVAPGLLARFVWFDDERTMSAAMVLTAVLALMANSEHGVTGAVEVALGGFIAAEIASHGARVRRAAPLPRLRHDSLPTVAVAASATALTLVTALIVRAGVPTAVSVAGAAMLALAVVAVVLRQPATERANGE